MNLKLYKVLGVLGTLLLLSACEEQPCGCATPDGQPVVFEYRYRNWAWGYQDHGWIIDGAGAVKGFSFPDGFRLPDSTGLITAADLEHNLGLTDTLLQQISKAELENYAALIPAAAQGEIGERQNIAADAGSSVLSAYYYDEDAAAYRRVFLAESGDWEQQNLSPEASDITEWLLDFGVFWLSE